MRKVPPTVLIVEDEPLVLLHVEDVALAAGFRTLTASSAEEALQKLAAQEVRILLTDIGLSGKMDGLGLVGVVGDRWPSIQIVITSGRFSKPELGSVVFLPKPFTSNQLLAALVGVL